MTRKELTNQGLQMFKTSCSNVKLFKDSNGTRWWTGATCEGGGAEAWHKMNEDLMTPIAVAYEVGHIRAVQSIKAIMRKAEDEANEAAFSFYNKPISKTATH